MATDIIVNSNSTPYESLSRDMIDLGATLRASSTLSTPIGAGTANMQIPNSLTGPLVWSGADLQDEKAFSLYLTPEDIAEIDQALKLLKDLDLDDDKVAKSNFPLAQLTEKLYQCAQSLHQGRGFFVIKAPDLARYSVEDSTLIQLGISSYIGDERGIQDARGNILTHITSSKVWDTPMDQRHGIHSNMALPFHTDMGCDILALQVRQNAHKNGSTYVSSASTVFNQLQREDAAAIQTLFKCNWPVQYTGRDAQHYLAPVMTMHGGQLMTSMDPKRFGPHPASRGSSIPALTKDQEGALQKVVEAAASSELRLDLQTGDLLFINNWALFHRREAYTDDAATSRHLVRMWLRNTELGWSIPPTMLPPWQKAYGDVARGKPRRYALHPSPKYTVPKYSAGSAAFIIEDSDESE